MCDNQKNEDVRVMQNIIDVLEDVAGATLHTDETLKEAEREKNVAFMQGMLDTLNKAEDSSISDIIRERIKEAGAKFHANSNIAEFIEDGELDELIDETTIAFEKVLDCLLIDRENDPNSMDTPRRLAKMYINELMRGRFFPEPKVTSFPNKHTNRETGFSGLLVVKSELISICSHHWQPVRGTAYIGIIPNETVIGLSKYTRIAQFLAQRGTLQEELAEDIAEKIMEVSGSDSVAVFVDGRHGCCENRGIGAHDSMTQTTVLKGSFLSEPELRKEFHDNITFQKMNDR